MSPTLIVLSIFIITIALLTVGIIFVKDGYKKDDAGNKNKHFLVTGWILLGVATAGALFVTAYAVWEYRSILLVILLFLSPLVVFGGIIASLAVGIYSLIDGYVKKKTSKIVGGYVAIGVFITIILSIIILIVWFSNYLNAHPISLM